MIAAVTRRGQVVHNDGIEPECAAARRVAAIATESTLRLPLFPDEDQATQFDEAAAPASNPASDPFGFGVHLLALANIRGVGFQTIRSLVKHYGDLRLIWGDDTPTIRDVLSRAKVRDAARIAAFIAANGERLLVEGEATFSKLRRANIRVLPADDPAFPQRLNELPDGPLWLFVEGNPSVLNDVPLLGIVGTRDPSRQGIRTTRRVTSLLTGEGFAIVSGLAEGIDAAAHTTALYYRVPQVAVLGTGINVVFPQSTKSIRQRIVELGGAIISEYLPNDSYEGSRFVQRDRLQAGLSMALTPVESRAKSGTAHTVRFAERYRRPLFGVQFGEPVPENEIVPMLRESGHPIFDLERTDGVEALFGFLRQVVGDRWPTPQPPPSPEWLFRTAIRALEEIEADFQLTDRDKHWFVNEVARRYNVHR